MSICSVNQNHLKAVCNYTGLYIFFKLSLDNRQAQQKDVCHWGLEKHFVIKYMNISDSNVENIQTKWNNKDAK